MNFVALVSALEALASGRVEQAALERYESIPLNDGKGLLQVIVRGAHVFGEAGEAFIADIGVAVSQVVRMAQGTAQVGLMGTIAELGDLRVFGAIEAVDGWAHGGAVAARGCEGGRHRAFATAECMRGGGGAAGEPDAAAARRAGGILARGAHLRFGR